MSYSPLIATLQDYGAAITEAIARFQSRWPDEITCAIDDGMPITGVHPLLYIDAFPTLSFERVQPLAVVGRLTAALIAASTALCDGKQTSDLAAMLLLRVQVLQCERDRVLHEVFPPTSPFWGYWDMYLVEYAQAYVTRQRFASGVCPWGDFTVAVAEQVAIGMGALDKGVVAGLAGLAGDERLVAPLAMSIEQYCVARQYVEDVRHWSEDFQYKRPSLLLAGAIDPWQCCDDVPAFGDRVVALGARLSAEGHRRRVLEAALVALDRADQALGGVPPILWRDMIADLRQQCCVLLHDCFEESMPRIRRVRSDSLGVLGSPTMLFSWEALPWEVLRVLLWQWRLGFDEARHVVAVPYFPDGYDAPAYIIGDVFQRAVIADALCDANDVLADRLRLVVRDEVAYLLGTRQDSGVGGWGYFPLVPEIAPDIGTVGQVMQVFLRLNHRALFEQFCLPLVDSLLSQADGCDGSFATWVVPTVGETQAQFHRDVVLRRPWGGGADVDGMATLLYALALYDDERFAPAIQAGARYIALQQCGDGSWVSRWYCGAYYSTYVCLRLLVRVHPASPAVAQAQQFLSYSQHADGGWGLGTTSDPLSTAFAVLGLASIAQARQAVDRVRVLCAIDYLRQCWAEHSTWLRVPFIQMWAGEPYGSRTITYAFVLKAALVCGWLMTLPFDHSFPFEGCQRDDHEMMGLVGADGVPAALTFPSWLRVV